MSLRVGIDVGSTTVKLVVLDENQQIRYKKYVRHLSQVRESTVQMLTEAATMLAGQELQVAIAGSAGLGLAESCGIDFVQEVYAARLAVDSLLPQSDVVVELGGEDAKIIFLTGGSEERMNGSCAGGTGAFIDQMATLLGLPIGELDALALQSSKVYNIASRCGVFAKSDIQSLLNQGASKADIAMSIYQAVVDQTIAGLAQGRKIAGRVVFLGGPLTFLQGLRQRFALTLQLSEQDAIFPENSEYYVAIGAALHAGECCVYTYEQVQLRLEEARNKANTLETLAPLFADAAEYAAFEQRHAAATVATVPIEEYAGEAYLGIDAGSTTTKMVLITPDGRILYQFYQANQGEPLPIIKQQLMEILTLCGQRIQIKSSAVTGYGEELIKHAFGIDYGLVETVAHFKGAQHFDPQVDFIMDIGGQDMKCLKIRNGAIDSIMLNEACSSGCGSFIETFAKALGFTAAEFAKIGTQAKHPVNLGSRCTVFMNSSVKQAQKDGAGLDDISAGLAMSVVKNAIYKVIRAVSGKSLGQHIVVQGGTFYNPAVLRSFEQEIGQNVTRPTIAGVMGAYGCALYAQAQAAASSSLITLPELQKFEHNSRNTVCNGCTNKCRLTVNIFNGGVKYIFGNRCSKPLGEKESEKLPNAYEYKRNYIQNLPQGSGRRGKIGLPLGLNMYENIPFWHAFFTALDFEVVLSGFSSRALYAKGQYSIPSDTVCYPAKLMHGHIETLLEQGVETIFYPCMPYNFNEQMSDNNYNCPVVAYYPELLHANVSSLQQVRFLLPYLGLHRAEDFANHIATLLHAEFGIAKREVKQAVVRGYAAYDEYRQNLQQWGKQTLEWAAAEGREVVVLCGRPYHIDPEVNHGIDNMITSLGLVVISEDSLTYAAEKPKLGVLNQWTYHARLYAAANQVGAAEHLHLVQLVSFGCGLDAITTDEVRDILEKHGKLYTQIKIDEISDLGAARIRIRSLIAAIEDKKGQR